MHAYIVNRNIFLEIPLITTLQTVLFFKSHPLPIFNYTSRSNTTRVFLLKDNLNLPETA